MELATRAGMTGPWDRLLAQRLDLAKRCSELLARALGATERREREQILGEVDGALREFSGGRDTPSPDEQAPRPPRMSTGELLVHVEGLVGRR
jgi:hypothetical protein